MKTKFNGLLIDCSRVIERHSYYFRLLNFMSQWNMNTLIFHFSDDQRCSVRLPGFPELSSKHSFSPGEVKKLVKYANRRGIDIIPEVETFGHALYITGVKKYSHLFAGRTGKKRQGSLDPLSLETLNLVQRLIFSTIKLFNSRYVHIGCDEVEIAEYCKIKGGLDPAVVWADYVNRVIEIAQRMGKIPVMWADHPAGDEKIARLLRKDVLLIQWDYWEKMEEEKLKRLIRNGFKEIVMAPSIACVHERFSPTRYGLNNTLTGAKFNKKYCLNGLINTVWCPYRYFQGAMYYGIAYSAAAAASRASFNVDKFNSEFVKKTFGVKAGKSMLEYLRAWPDVEITNGIGFYLAGNTKFPLSKRDHKRAAIAHSTGKRIIPLAASFSPAKNGDIWKAMQLAVKAGWIVSEYYIIKKQKIRDIARIKKLNTGLKALKKEIIADWDKTRFADDPYKLKTKFGSESSRAAIPFLRKLKNIN